MPDDPNPTTIQLRIRSYTFEIPLRYTPGHQITPAEAQALNQTYSENIRNNVDSWVRSALSGASPPVLSKETHRDLARRIFDYASRYQFRSQVRSRLLSPFEAAISELAAAQAEAEGRQQGFAPDSPEVQLRYRQLLTDPAAADRARLILAERAEIAARAADAILPPPQWAEPPGLPSDD